MNFKDQARYHAMLIRRHAAERVAAAHAAEAARAAHASHQPAAAQNPAQAAEIAPEPAQHAPLRRFNRQQAGSRQARRSGGGDQNTLQAGIGIQAGDTVLPITSEEGTNFGGGQGSSGGERNQDDPNARHQATLQERDPPPLTEGGRAMADIVSAYVAGAAGAASEGRAAHGGVELARTLIALRDSQARHGDKAPLNHAVLRVVRECLSMDAAPADLPRSLAEVRELLSGLTPKAVSAEELRLFHLKLPLVLLNLRRPRSDAQRTGARASISALLSRSAL